MSKVPDEELAGGLTEGVAEALVDGVGAAVEEGGRVVALGADEDLGACAVERTGATAGSAALLGAAA